MIPQCNFQDLSLCCRFMVGCEGCDGWFHPRCIGVTRATVDGWQSEGKDYICDECQSWPHIVLNVHFFSEKKSTGNSKNPTSDASTSKQSRSRKKSRDESIKARPDGSEASDEENSNEHPAKTRREERSSELKGSSSRSRASQRRPASHHDFVTDEGDLAAALESVCRAP